MEDKPRQTPDQRAFLVLFVSAIVLSQLIYHFSPLESLAKRQHFVVHVAIIAALMLSIALMGLFFVKALRHFRR